MEIAAPPSTAYQTRYGKEIHRNPHTKRLFLRISRSFSVGNFNTGRAFGYYFQNLFTSRWTNCVYITALHPAFHLLRPFLTLIILRRRAKEGKFVRNSSSPHYVLCARHSGLWKEFYSETAARASLALHTFSDIVEAQQGTHDGMRRRNITVFSIRYTAKPL